MSCTCADRDLELRLHRGTSTKSTGTDLSMEDIGHLEALQREIRELREEVALLEARLRLRERGEPQGVGDVPALPQAEANPGGQRQCTSRDVQTARGGRGFKTEPGETWDCVYSRGAKSAAQNLHRPPAAPPCGYSDPGAAEARDAARGDEAEGLPGPSPRCFAGADPEGTRDSGAADRDRDGLQEAEQVKRESAVAVGDAGDQGDRASKLMDGRRTLERRGGIKEEEDADGYHGEHFLSSGLAAESGPEERAGPEESGYGAAARTEPPCFISDEHFNGCGGKEKPYVCFWCGKDFRSASPLRAHLSAHENAEGAPECFLAPAAALVSHGGTERGAADKLYPCIHCGMTFADLSHCKSHEKSHAADRPYRCPKCGMSFAFLYSFQNHEREHLGEPNLKPYQCSYCSKQFTTRATLIIHHRTHTGERPYQCCFCDQAFTRSDRLKEHERIHTGEKPYQCNSCGKQFSQAASLRTHQRIHTGEKPYRCSSCDKQFSDLTGLRTHERQHTGEKPYHCLQCGKSFTQASNLRAHRKVHAAEQASFMFPV